MADLPHQDQDGQDRFARRVLDRIEGEHVRPRPRWAFTFRNAVFWLLGVLAVVLGGVAVSAMLFEWTSIDWRVAVVTHGGLLRLLVETAPYLWVFILAVFLFAGYAVVRATQHGYRYRFVTIAAGTALAALALGGFIHLAGWSGAVEEAIGDHPPFYRPIMVAQRAWWLAPEHGFLGGTVVSVGANAATFTVRDFSGTLWIVSGDDLGAPDRAAVARGGMIRIVGVPTTATSSYTFHACFAFPWKAPGAPRAAAPLAVLSATSSAAAESDACQGILPYHALRDIDDQH
jgi:hypothetical protein